MKRHIAPRKIKNCCLLCSKPILKGHVYYTKRRVYDCGSDGIIGITKHFCARCNYENKDSVERYERFKPNCHHPEPLIHEVWSYIPGEAVMQPDHCECTLCGEWL